MLKHFQLTFIISAISASGIFNILILRIAMKIVSKYKDYYDAGLVYWIDEKLYFKRELIKEESPQRYGWDLSSYKDWEYRYDIELFPLLIWFCGEIYPLCRVVYKTTIRNKIETLEEIVYSYDELIIFLKWHWYTVSSTKEYSWQRWGDKKDFLFFKNERLDLDIYAYKMFLEWLSHEYCDFWEQQDYSEIIEYFYEKKLAYFILWAFEWSIDKDSYSGKEIIWHNYFISNPILKDYQFSKVKDAYTAFQEISMFLGKMQEHDDKMVEVDDKHKAFSKGYCCHSFRKKSTKKKKKKCGKKMNVE